MRRKWLLAASTVVLLLATACSKSEISSAQGRERANAARKPTAEVYWTLYNSISGPVFSSDGGGHFTRCGKNGSTSITYVVRSVLATKEKRGVTLESLTQTVATQLSDLGWHLSPASGPQRSVKKGGITVKLEPPEFTGSDPMTALQVQGECVDVGSAADSIIDGYYQHEDEYSGADASKSPVPTTFPSPIG